MSTGQVKWFDKKKGYGFASCEEKEEDIFIHYTAFVEEFILNNDDHISFEIVKGEKGFKAQNINKVG